MRIIDFEGKKVSLIKLSIDGKEVEVEQGSTVLDAAKKLGIEIPTLCYHEMLEPYGGCRVCTVEIGEGEATELVTSCNRVADDGMIVKTDTERVLKARRLVVELLLGRCSGVEVIRDLASKLGIEESRFGKGEETCILCGLCVRTCSEIVKADAITFAERGFERKVATPFDRISEVCITCGACAYVCPTGHIKIEDPKGRQILHSELSLGPKTAIHIPVMQAVPNVPRIDEDSCIHVKTGGCGVCEKVCEPEAIRYEQEEEEIEVEVGNIIVATGFDNYDCSKLRQYGYGVYDNVLSALEFEQMNSASGPTGGEILLANGEPPKSVAILHCIGSRDANAHEYCSRVCCMYSMKFAHLLREKTTAEVYELYIDMRCFGKGYEEFYNRILEEDVRIIRGKGAEVSDFAIFEGEQGKLIVRCEDTLVGQIRRIPVDMVVLASGLEATADAKEVARMFSIGQGKDGWFIEKHPKLAPVSTTTDGVFIAGCCQGPKDIPDTVAQGSAAASAVLSLICQGQVEIEATTAFIDPDLCSGCKTCNTLCPYSAITFDAEKAVSEINEALCKGCGTCVAACPSSAICARGFTDQQMFAEIEGLMQKA